LNREEFRERTSDARQSGLRTRALSRAMKWSITMSTDSTPEPTLETKTPQTTPKPEPLQLPKGALIAFRQSGGAPVSAREIVLYPDGRVSFGGPDLGKEMYAHVPRKMNDAQIARLRKTLEHANFFRMASAQEPALSLPEGESPPDAFAYEIVARAGNRVNSVTVFDGAIPDALTPLLQQLGALMPKE
jgi:hypothetical protein